MLSLLEVTPRRQGREDLEPSKIFLLELVHSFLFRNEHVEFLVLCSHLFKFSELVVLLPLDDVLTLLHLKYYGLLALSDVEQPERVLDQASLHHLVDFGVVVEARALVHFQEPWPEIAVEHDVEAQDLEALPEIASPAEA